MNHPVSSQHRVGGRVNGEKENVLDRERCIIRAWGVTMTTPTVSTSHSTSRKRQYDKMKGTKEKREREERQ